MAGFQFGREDNYGINPVWPFLINQYIQLIERLPISVRMNDQMVQYLRHALKNDANVTQELDRILGSSSNLIAGQITARRDMLQLAKEKGIFSMCY